MVTCDLGAKTPCLHVLLSPDLHASILSYQDGIYLDMRPFLDVSVPRISQFHVFNLVDDCFHRIMTHDFHPRMTSWLAQSNLDRLSLLLDCLPFLRDNVLEYAAWSGNVALLDWFHQNHNGLDSLEGHYLVDIAAERGHLSVLERLFTCGYHEAIDMELLQRVIKRDNLAVIRFVVQHFAPDIVWTENEATSLLDTAIAVGCLDCVQFFLDEHVLSTTFPSNQRFVTAAARMGHYDVTRALLERGLDDSGLSMDVAAQGGSLPLVQHLHDLGGYACTTEGMNQASNNGHMDVVRWLHATRDEGCTTTAVDCAAQRGHLEVVQFLHMHYPTQVNGLQTTAAAEWAAGNGHLDVLQYLHTHNLCDLVSTVLFRAVLCGQTKVAQWLNDVGTTLAMCATPILMDTCAENGHLAMLDWLHINYPEAGCTTKAMHSAISNGHVEVVQWLMVHGYVVGVDGSSFTSQGALAGIEGRLPCPQRYMDDADGFNLRGAMTCAALLGHIEMIRWLLQSTEHVCASDVLVVCRLYGLDNLMTHVLCKKASGEC
ncbi:Aste57867_18537 [Aphanomyces stellatus]|uniref:Aste57867_18537 protein n=1 Tax=Aphanomyces stellatus TaxID=120398 RepID=A0A485LAK4_9STRA|nr:hypothetical protein As57867_018475 [Aphanomyces stellatus]VFT95273.1 Aste57867_18537 [Aphanomyces stellatus]